MKIFVSHVNTYQKHLLQKRHWQNHLASWSYTELTWCAPRGMLWCQRRKLCVGPTAGTPYYQDWLSYCYLWMSILSATETNTEPMIQLCPWRRPTGHWVANWLFEALSILERPAPHSHKDRYLAFHAHRASTSTAIWGSWNAWFTGTEFHTHNIWSVKEI